MNYRTLYEDLRRTMEVTFRHLRDLSEERDHLKAQLAATEKQLVELQVNTDEQLRALTALVDILDKWSRGTRPTDIQWIVAVTNARYALGRLTSIIRPEEVEWKSWED